MSFHSKVNRSFSIQVRFSLPLHSKCVRRRSINDQDRTHIASSCPSPIFAISALPLHPERSFKLPLIDSPRVVRDKMDFLPSHRHGTPRLAMILSPRVSSASAFSNKSTCLPSLDFEKREEPMSFELTRLEISTTDKVK